MPYSQEHSARITDPGQYDRFARKNIDPGVDIILGIKEGKSEAQAYRFDKTKFTVAEAKAWLKRNNIKYISFEPAKEEEKMKYVCKDCNFLSNDEDKVCNECGGELIEMKEEKIKNKLETKELRGVEIMEAGTWQGENYSTEDFDEAIKNNKDGLIEAYLNIDHNDKLTDVMRRQLNAMSMGFISKLYRMGKKLMADFQQVPKLIAELIQAGALKKRSVEWWKNYKHANGTVLGNVLEAVTFFGGHGVPAVNTLADVVNLYKATLKNKELIEQDSGQKTTINFSKQEVQNMDEILKLKNDLQKLQTDKEEADRRADLADKKAVEAEKKADEAELKAAEAEKAIEEQKETTLKTEGSDYIKAIVDSEKLLPKFVDMKVDEYIRLKAAGDEKGLKLFKEELESRDKVINFGSIIKGEDMKAPTKFKSEDSDGMGDPTERAQGMIEKRMSQKNINWKEAAIEVGMPGMVEDGGDK